MRMKLAAIVLVLSVSAADLFAVSPDKKFYDEDGDRIFENLADRMRRTDPHENIPVVILYQEGTPVAGTLSARLSRVSQRSIKRSFKLIPAVAAKLTPSEIRMALNDPLVRHIELDAEVKATMVTARDSFGVEKTVDQFGFDGDLDGIPGNYSANDVVVAMIDTGVDIRHPDLRKKVLYFRDYINNRTSAYDDNGHGTHVAGVAAGAGKLDADYAGVAPGAALVVFKALNSLGSGSLSDVIAALEEIVAKKSEYHIRVVNLSLEAAGSSDGRDAFSVACNETVKNGIVTVMA